VRWRIDSARTLSPQPVMDSTECSTRSKADNGFDVLRVAMRVALLCMLVCASCLGSAQASSVAAHAELLAVMVDVAEVRSHAPAQHCQDEQPIAPARALRVPADERLDGCEPTVDESEENCSSSICGVRALIAYYHVASWAWFGDVPMLLAACRRVVSPRAPPASRSHDCLRPSRTAV
jgi:hypothetical protein